jgi:hypothetical protein
VALLYRVNSIRDMLAKARAEDSPVGAVTTDDDGWGRPVFAMEVAMFALGRDAGAPFSHAAGRLRRRLEAVEGAARPAPEALDEALSACDAMAELLAGFLMGGHHRRNTGPPGGSS